MLKLLMGLRMILHHWYHCMFLMSRRCRRVHRNFRVRSATRKPYGIFRRNFIHAQISVQRRVVHKNDNSLVPSFGVISLWGFRTWRQGDTMQSWATVILVQFGKCYKPFKKTAFMALPYFLLMFGDGFQILTSQDRFAETIQSIQSISQIYVKSHKNWLVSPSINIASIFSIDFEKNTAQTFNITK